ncbi:hypothetical protein [Parafrankia elaeagni]|uniref:hypothetical protein n=1 Tax=Parafrankia elaeagni TaxID=222534 RepID=UPI0012B5AF68|nr:hypothetical protein [Parafrankia elaeagni]
MDAADVWVELDGAVRWGARASALTVHAPGLVDVLFPPDGVCDLVVRAVAAEGLLRLAVEGMEPREGAAVAALLDLADGLGNAPMGVRRRRAAAALGVTHWALEKPARREGLLLALAVEVCRVAAYTAR